MLKKYFPHSNNKNIKIFYFQSFLFVGYLFLQANWLFYFLNHISLEQVAIVETFGILTGILTEIPSGAIADLLGKKRSLFIGGILTAIGGIVFILFQSFYGFLFGNIIGFWGFSFISGSLEAFSYDTLKDNNLEHEYSKIVSGEILVRSLAALIMPALSGILFSINEIYPTLAFSIVNTMAAILCIFADEPKNDSQQFTLNNFWLQQKEGFKVLFGKHLRVVAFIVIALGFLLELYQGVVRQSLAGFFSFTGETNGYLMSLVTIPGMLIGINFERILKKFGEYKLLILISCTYAVGFGLAIWSEGSIVLGGFVFLAIYTIEKISRPITSVLINERIPSKYRATTISVYAFLTRIPYLILITFFIELTTKQNIPYLLIGYTLIALLALIYTVSVEKKIKSTTANNQNIYEIIDL
ncbi:MFS transporter [Candidatus Dojkabacteria bacterium]|uniref:MFS transporter n=1 Tax=Candidatus Dojkabacteria bacterium TaxID=2099670 RepID=A0A955L942_9BACT|nr:MFS transporter [Candidatus Dojkabacteria bacterium]